MDWDEYVDDVCKSTASSGTAIDSEKCEISYRDGALVAPLAYEMDEFSGTWFVQFGIALGRRFRLHRLDLGQARFRFSGAADVRHPEAIRKNEAEVKRDNLIEALDRRFGANQVNTAATSPENAMVICQRLWPCQR